nr:MAG TPA: hypothetical protein [Caudoviricetes sp.]
MLHLFAAAIFRDPISYPKHRGGEVLYARKLRGHRLHRPQFARDAPKIRLLGAERLRLHLRNKLLNYG